MPKISLWKNFRDRDYYFVDKNVKDYMDQGATGVHLHKYVGPKSGGNETTIDDVLFLENRSRKYSDNIYELRGFYPPEDNELDLSQFGIFLTSKTIFMVFHYESMIEILGRKIIAGDVLELPHLRDFDLLRNEDGAVNRFYVVEEASMAASGYGPRWWGHLWRVKAKVMDASEEFSDIIGEAPGDKVIDDDWEGSLPEGVLPGDKIGEAGCPGSVACEGTTGDRLIEITDGIIEEAAKNVPFDPNWFDVAHLWVVERKDGGFDLYQWAGEGVGLKEWGGTGVPPNGYPIVGEGDGFPTDMKDGEFFLRTDFVPERLYRKNGDTYQYIESDVRRKWTPVNSVLDSFIDNDTVRSNDDCSKGKEKTKLSKAVKAKTNLNAKKYKEIYGKEPPK